MRLLQVQRGLIAVEREGVRQEIRVGSTDETEARGEQANTPPESLSNEVERLLDLRAQKFQQSLESRSRNMQ